MGILKVAGGIRSMDTKIHSYRLTSLDFFFVSSCNSASPICWFLSLKTWLIPERDEADIEKICTSWA